jgi:ketosteroid isomerase-like protein
VLSAAALYAVLCMAGSNQGLAEASGPNPDPKTLQETVDTLIAAAAKGDDASLARFQASHMTVIDGQGFTQGATAYHSKVPARAGHAGLRKFRTKDVAIHESGNIGWVTYLYRLSAPASDGHSESIFGLATIILEKTNGQWKIVHAHTTGRPEKKTDPEF